MCIYITVQKSKKLQFVSLNKCASVSVNIAAFAFGYSASCCCVYMSARSMCVCCADSGKQEHNEFIHTELVPDKTLLHLHVGMIWIQVQKWLTEKKTVQNLESNNSVMW